MENSTEIIFRKKYRWSCPSYGEFYIQDKEAGRDTHGNMTYVYALFKKRPFRPIKRFRKRKQAYEYLSNITCVSREMISDNLYRIHNDSRYFRILYNKTIFQIDKHTRELSSKPTVDEQITGWIDKYKNCLESSKEIILKRLYCDSLN